MKSVNELNEFSKLLSSFELFEPLNLSVDINEE